MPWLAIAAAVAIGYLFTRSSGSRTISGWIDTPNPPKDATMCFPCGPWRYQASNGQLWYVYLVTNEWGASKNPTTNDKDILLRDNSSDGLVKKMEA